MAGVAPCSRLNQVRAKHMAMGDFYSIECDGIDYPWFARDPAGQIAMLCSAGTGLVPSPCIALYDLSQEFLDWLAVHDGDWESWVVERGLYLYDVPLASLWQEFMTGSLMRMMFGRRGSQWSSGLWYTRTRKPVHPLLVQNIPTRFLPVVSVACAARPFHASRRITCSQFVLADGG